MKPYLQDADFTLWNGDARSVLSTLPAESVDCCVTSPPYLDARNEYGTLNAAEWSEFFRELRRVVTGPALFNVGRLWRNGRESNWWMQLLQIASESWDHLDTLVWVKPNANPIHGRLFANSHEYVLILGDAKTAVNVDAIRTEYDAESLARFTRRYRNGGGVKGEVREQEGRELNELGARSRSFFIAYVGREKGNDHPAPMPAELAEHLVSLASWPKGTVLDPFAGSGTTALAARKLGRSSIAIEKNADYCALIARRTQQLSLEAEVA